MTTPKTAKSTVISAAVHQEAEGGELVVSESVEPAVKKSGNGSAPTEVDVEAAVELGPELFKGYDEFLQFGKDNLEALVTSGNIIAREVQDFSKSVVTLASESFEESVSVGKALADAKTLEEVIDLSSSLAKASFDKLVAGSSKFSDLSTKLAEEVLAPLNSRIDVAVQKLTKIAA